jgi:prepilin-type N-terminal cleavage/methylation domain-containing protein
LVADRGGVPPCPTHLDPINAPAESTPGFVWWRRDDAGGSSGLIEVPGGDATNTSIGLDGLINVLWWIPAGEVPVLGRQDLDLTNRKPRRSNRMPRSRRKTHRRDSGFTLVELLIVIVMLGILATIAVFAVRSISSRGEQAACATGLITLQTAPGMHLAMNVVFADEATLRDRWRLGQGGLGRHP